MPSQYGSKGKPRQMSKEERDKSTSEKKQRQSDSMKLTKAQKESLKKHMDKLKSDGMSSTDRRSHRMKMLSRMAKGMSLKESHKDIGK
jgi:hypothetical protein